MDAGYHDRLRKEIAASGIDGAMVFAGHREDIEALLAMADAFLLPSFWEGWSLALAEARCANLPVVVTDVGGAREQLAGGGGRLVRPPFESITDMDYATINQYLHRDDPRFARDLAEAMKDVCADPQSPALSAALRQTFDRSHAYAAYAHIFRWMIQGGSPAGARAWLHDSTCFS